MRVSALISCDMSVVMPEVSTWSNPPSQLGFRCGSTNAGRISSMQSSEDEYLDASELIIVQGSRY